MKRTQLFFFIALCLGFLSVNELSAQYGYGYGSPYGMRYGRQQRIVPNAGPTESKKDETPPTADEIVDQQMPSITEEIGLDPFEQAVVRTALLQAVQQKIELQILELEPLKMKEEFEKVDAKMKEELKAGLPEEKFNAFVELQENSFKTQKKKKKKRKKD